MERESFEPKLESIGDRILGEVNPRTLTRDEFEQSPELLFHGAVKPIDFNQAFDYRAESYLRENDGSTTLGFGFYATDHQEAAANYSVVRTLPEVSPVFVAKLLPYEAKVLDLRAKTDNTRNAPVSRALAERWQQRFEQYFQARKPRKGFLGKILDSSEVEYYQYLQKVLQLEEIDLRVLLETVPAPQVGSRNLPSPTWTQLFSEFMLEQGYDGLVYNEGGEGENAIPSASYIFYNLRKIGTYETWQQQE